MKSRFVINKLLTGVLMFLIMTAAHAGNPLWTFTPDVSFPPKVSLSSTGTATVKYTVTNQSTKKHTLVMQPQQGVSQAGLCQLSPKGSCTLILTITGSKLPAHGFSGGPVLCQASPDGTPNPNQCYQPSQANSLNITVNSVANLVSIAVTPANPSIAKGTTQQFIATGTYSDSSQQNITSSVTWSSSATSVATISNTAGSNGLATGVSAGTTSITATMGSVSGTTSLSVTNATLVSLAVTPPDAQIAQGTTQQYTATGTFSDASTQNLTTSVTWSSSNTTVATISNTAGTQGLATGNTAGTTTITATSGSVSGTAYLNVTNATLVSIAVTPANPSVGVGATKQFIATGTYSDSSQQNITSSVTWSSSNTGIATISNVAGSNGLATGVSVGGPITITATMGSVSGSTGLTVISVPLTTLTTTTAVLALSVNDTALNSALTGNPRTITIENNGTNTATNVTYTLSPALPSGSSISPASCGDIAPNATCTLTITPGSTPSAASGDISPTPITLIASGGNTNTLGLQIDILIYGSVYQGGYIYAVDDTTPTTGSIGGKVVSLADQAARYPGGIIWSSNSSGTYDGGVSLYGISETSTTSSPNPSTGQVAGQSACYGNSDGSCDTANIIAYYSPPTTSPAINHSYYAAGLCKATINGYADWYLPAICEMGPASNSSGCAAGTQNIISDFPDLVGDPGASNPSTSCTVGSNCLAGRYWSSTEGSVLPQNVAWYQYFASGGGSVQNHSGKLSLLGVRCSRALTL
jgi:uncharacterized protein YjdB